MDCAAMYLNKCKPLEFMSFTCFIVTPHIAWPTKLNCNADSKKGQFENAAHFPLFSAFPHLNSLFR